MCCSVVIILDMLQFERCYTGRTINLFQIHPDMVVGDGILPVEVEAGLVGLGELAESSECDAIEAFRSCF
jgi:hypothetical protein